MWAASWPVRCASSLVLPQTMLDRVDLYIFYISLDGLRRQCESAPRNLDLRTLSQSTARVRRFSPRLAIAKAAKSSPLSKPYCPHTLNIHEHIAPSS
jgi:hypothetical protein